MGQVKDNRLLCMGLLSGQPLKSKVLQHFLEPGRGKKYSDSEKAHMVGLWWMPGLPHNWIRHQLATLAPDRNTEHLIRYIKTQAYNPENRRRWEYLGEQNVTYIGQPEVERYFHRRKRGNTRIFVPFWALPVINDHLKQGWTMVKIAKHYDIHMSLVQRMKKRSMFHPYGWQKENNHLRENWIKSKYPSIG